MFKKEHYRESMVENNSKTAYSTFKRQKNTHTPTTVAKRDGNSHITLEITHFRHTSEGNVSLPPPASSSVKTTRTTNQYPKTREWFEPNNVETHASPPLHQEKGKSVIQIRKRHPRATRYSATVRIWRQPHQEKAKTCQPNQEKTHDRYSVTV